MEKRKLGKADFTRAEVLDILEELKNEISRCVRVRDNLGTLGANEQEAIEIAFENFKL